MTRNLRNQLVQPAGRRSSDSLVPPKERAAIVKPSIFGAPNRLLETLVRGPYNFIQRGFYPQTILASRIANTLAMREPQAVRRAYALYLASLRNPDQLITFRREGTEVVNDERFRLTDNKVVIQTCTNRVPISDGMARESVEGDRIIYLARNEQLSIGRTGFGDVTAEKLPKGLAGSRLLIPFGKNHGLVEVSGADLRLMGFWQTHLNVLLSARDLANVVFMRTIADTDTLTGLFNRRIFDETMSQNYAEYLANGTNAALVMLDIDKFKRVNDVYGHLAGDSVLAQVASCVSRTLRANDIVTLTRFGGEEFAILLPGADTKGGAIAAERCRAELEAHPAVFETYTIPVTGSFGVSSFLHAERLAKMGSGADGGLTGPIMLPPGPQDAESILKLTHKLADGAVYEAKEGGRNRVVSSTFEAQTNLLTFEGPK